ncbi:uncharacterized protein EI90DRAFT_3071928 [Cantharellus anzutake]|nr:uncharacterized protein EI90DRAFT_3071928 [Cantharellus anzutake]KAF8325855.1 hypothetical protein EI90DRAFT_3071928 [Cantharellus anzutake]
MRLGRRWRKRFILSQKGPRLDVSDLVLLPHLLRKILQSGGIHIFLRRFK